MAGINFSVQQLNLDMMIILALERLSQVFKTLLWDRAKQEGLSPIQIQFLLYIVSRQKQESFVTDIAREFNLTPATVSDAIKSLEQKNLIKKNQSGIDQRKYILKLTQSGNKLSSQLMNWQDPLLEHLSQFSMKTRETIVPFLLKFMESLRDSQILPNVKTCFSCSYFQDRTEEGKENTYYCILRNVSLKNLGLRLDCKNYQSYKVI